MGGRRIAIALAGALAACVGTSGLTGGDPTTTPEAGAPDGSPDAPEAIDSGGDAVADAGADALTRCTASGQTVYPVDAFDVTPAADGGVSAGFTCNARNALVEDGKVAGLDRTSSAGGATIDGHGVAGCIAVAFADAFPLSAGVIRLASTANACGAACVPSATDAGCGTGDTAVLFWGSVTTDLHFIQSFDATTKLTDDLFVLPATAATRYLVVCRQAYSSDRDDIAVDSVRATCR